ncbi:MAG TPA: TIGR01777 family oxidoreductase [Candidatus Limnocylindria bacterium]|nr:TIGR01777 family oxidoreductase [Candidatus Limnocylindria bacterium]
MKLVVTGASGFIGALLVDRLWSQNHSLILLSRTPPAEVNVAKKEWLVWRPGVPGDWEQSLDGADGIVNLAGEPIAAKRWTETQKEKIRWSRIESTRALVGAIAKVANKPKFLINASAVGYYGPRGDEPVTEDSPPGSDFLARVCADWETEAKKAEAHGVRVVLLRTGIVLDKNKGALAKMVPPFKFFLGGPFGAGNQWLPWIHVEDEIGLVLFAIENEKARGAVNATAPNPVTMGEFCRILGDALNRPSWATVPSGVLALLMGEMSDLLLTGQRAVPQAALQLGYRFKYPDLLPALRSLRL